jgi:uncharacterized membrane protein (DUF485 family)
VGQTEAVPEPAPSEGPDRQRLIDLWHRRRRRSFAFAAALLFGYAGFIASLAFRSDWLGRFVVPNLSLAIVLGFVIVIAAFALTWIYPRHGR